jgi:transposase
MQRRFKPARLLNRDVPIAPSSNVPEANCMGSMHVARSNAVANRMDLLQQAAEHLITQRSVATALGLSYRQVKRLVARYRANGAAGMTAPSRVSNHRLPAGYIELILKLVREHYSNCGPSAARLQLQRHHGLQVGRETLRTLMRDAGIWLPRSPARHVATSPLPSKQRLGELVYIAGRSQRWFKERAPICTLLMFFDTASSRLQLLRFIEGQATFDYMQAAKAYVQRHGKPLAFYDDSRAAVRVWRHKGVQSTRATQYGRALNELGIELLSAANPAVRARIRRTFRTWQNRLVREMHDRGLSSIREANAWIDSFVEVHNKRYARLPELPEDAHRALLPGESLDDIFTWREIRTLSSAFSLQYDKVLYLIEPNELNRTLAGKRVTVSEFPDGRIKITYQGREIAYREFDKQSHVPRTEIASHKRLGALLRLIGDKTHPLPRAGWHTRRNRRYLTRARQISDDQRK